MLGSSHYPAGIAVFFSCIALAVCIVFVPVILNEINSVWEECDQEAAEFKVIREMVKTAKTPVQR